MDATNKATETVYVVRDASGEYLRDASGDRRTPASDQANDFATAEEAQAACTRATDRVISREID